MYANFNGDFRRRPEQNLSGASAKLSRNDIILKAQQERLKREEQRLHLKSALQIQSYVRSYLVRQRFKQVVRNDFDELQRKSKALPNLQLDDLIKYLVFFYNKNIDYDKLLWICQHILKQHKEIVSLIQKDIIWNYRIKRLLAYCIDSIDMSRNNATYFRILDIFLMGNIKEDEPTFPITFNFFLYLTKKNYFKKMRIFLDESCKMESNRNLCVVLSNFIIRPITLLNITKESQNIVPYEDYKYKVLLSLCETMLCQPFTELVKDIFIVQLMQSTFPYDIFYKFVVDHQKEIDISVYFLYCALKLAPDFSNVDIGISESYSMALALASINIRKQSKFEKLKSLTQRAVNLDDDDDDFGMECIPTGPDLSFNGILRECVEMCNDEAFVNNLLLSLKEDTTYTMNVMNSLAQICFNLLTREENAVQKYKILYMLAFNPDFLRALWMHPDNVALLKGLQKGAQVLNEWYVEPACRFSTYCELFSLLLTTLHDDEFWSTDITGEKESVSSMPFSAVELVNICEYMKQLVEGLVELTVTSPSRPLTSFSFHSNSSNTNSETYMKFWLMLYKSTLKLVTNLYQKDSRIQFCPENLWTKKNIISFPTDYHSIEGVARVYAEIDVEDKPPLTTCEMRWLQVLRDVPFLLPFTSRVFLFRALVQRLHRQFQDPDLTPFLRGPSVNIAVRRSHIYEDAYLKLQDADLRQKLRVQFINTAGLEEAGIDGGGILREFLSELLKTCSDPNRGYFKLNRSNLLYPNPNVQWVDPDFSQHYYFIGKMLGKTLYENIQVDLPFAEFFLTKLVSKKFDVDFHYLASLDQVMYKNMLFLKNYQGNFQDLGLDFTIVNEELGEAKVDELKLNGSNIPVTSTNRIEYIHLLADYKMNKQVRQQCLAFKQGLHSVIDLSYLQIFSNKELQLIISGADYEVDIQDLKENTNYSGDRTADHPVIKIFWSIVEGFTAVQKRQLLKFVTSCSRPPLLGFKELQPSFSIQLADSTDRLPTASTCMNLLKIPAILDADLLRDRLLYAISQGAGFELS